MKIERYLVWKILESCSSDKECVKDALEELSSYYDASIIMKVIDEIQQLLNHQDSQTLTKTDGGVL